MSHNSRDSIRAELAVLPCSCLRRPQPLCRMLLPPHGLSLQIQHAPPGDRAFLFEPEKGSSSITKTPQIRVSVLAFVIYKVCDPKRLQGFGVKRD